MLVVITITAEATCNTRTTFLLTSHIYITLTNSPTFPQFVTITFSKLLLLLNS